MLPALAVASALGYLLGSIPFGLLIARSQGIDIRKQGSGNIGATNVWRVMGRKWGLLTFFCDFAKGLIAVLLAKALLTGWIVQARGYATPDDANYVGIAAAVACILGHSFPVWLRFRGGKGVATSVGVIGGVMPLASISIFITWGVVLKLTRYVSVASIAGALSLPLFTTAYLLLGWMHGWACLYFALVATTLVVVRHIPNMKRLAAGTENRMGAKKAAPPEA